VKTEPAYSCETSALPYVTDLHGVNTCKITSWCSIAKRLSVIVSSIDYEVVIAGLQKVTVEVEQRTGWEGVRPTDVATLDRQ
jgi:hypothetical protein